MSRYVDNTGPDGSEVEDDGPVKLMPAAICRSASAVQIRLSHFLPDILSIADLHKPTIMRFFMLWDKLTMHCNRNLV